MRIIAISAAAAAFVLGAPAGADETSRAADHAPLGVMGDHTHGKGEWMVSYRVMRMEMDGNRMGTDSIAPATIVTAIANINAPPATLRVVPLDMTMDMHMFGVMHGLTDRVTLMAMASYVEKEMDHLTFSGMSGTTELGGFRVKTNGFGDTKLTALIDLFEGENVRAHVGLGLSLPTGSIDEAARVLTPMNTTPILTAPYPMQLGSGTLDPMLSATVVRRGERVGLGAQGAATLRLYDNDAGYHLGNEFAATGWASWSFSPAVSVSGRLTARSWGEIEGADARVTAPVETADPSFQGGERIDAGVGLNLLVSSGPLKGHRLALEVTTPIHQDLNGVQLETDTTVLLGWQYSWR